MIEAKTAWVKMTPPDMNEVEELKSALGSSTMFASLCLQRNLKTKEEVDQFIFPDESGYHSPSALGEMDKAVERIHQAIKENEKITVYGDYDADGVTSTTILVETLGSLGAEVDYFIPNRFVHGYGPSVEAFEEIIGSGTSLILTCDNGVTGHEAITFARENDVEVIVTDHHELPDTLPEAYAIVHPRLPNFNYPFPELSGAGVAFKLAWALLDEKPTNLIGYAAIGTIADLVPLTGENRLIAHQGIKQLQGSRQVGIKAICDQAGIEQRSMDEDSIGFSIGPRLNAAGRLGDADPAVELFLSKEMDAAMELATFLTNVNEERKEIVEKITAEAMAEIEQMPDDLPIYLLEKPNWHEGVLGIVASRVVQAMGKPAILFNIDEDKGIAKGSGRSIGKINLYEALKECEDSLRTFGGHHMAAGLSVELDQFDAFKKQLTNILTASFPLNELKEETKIHFTATPTEITLEMIEELNQLAPFGSGNEKPKFLIEETMATGLRQIGTEGQHVKFFLTDEDHKMDVIGFGFPNVQEKLGHNPVVSAIGHLEINEWRNQKKVQLKLEDLQTEGVQYFDMRSKHFRGTIFDQPQTDFIFFNQKIKEQFEDRITNESSAVLIEEGWEQEYQKNHEKALIVECPPNLAIFESFMRQTNYRDMYLHFYSEDDFYLIGLPSRQEFATAYKFLLSQTQIDWKTKGELAAKHLKMNYLKLKFIIYVFFEVDFVTIDNGLIKATTNPTKVDLTNTNTFKKKEMFIQSQELLIYSSLSELIERFNEWKR